MASYILGGQPCYQAFFGCGYYNQGDRAIGNEDLAKTSGTLGDN